MENLDKHRGIVLVLALLIVLYQLANSIWVSFNYLTDKYVCIEKMSPPIKLPPYRKVKASVDGFIPSPEFLNSGQCCYEDCYTSCDPGSFCCWTVPP